MARKSKPDQESAAGAERRKHPRVRVKLHMIFDDGRTAVKARVVDLSLGGAFVEVAGQLEKGAQIRLTPILPGKEQGGPEVELKGRVVRVVEYNLAEVGVRMGAGIEFTGLGSRERKVLADIFRKSVEEAQAAGEAAGHGESGAPKVDSKSTTRVWSPPPLDAIQDTQPDKDKENKT